MDFFQIYVNENVNMTMPAPAKGGEGDKKKVKSSRPMQLESSSGGEETISKAEKTTASKPTAETADSSRSVLKPKSHRPSVDDTRFGH